MHAHAVIHMDADNTHVATLIPSSYNKIYIYTHTHNNNIIFYQCIRIHGTIL